MKVVAAVVMLIVALGAFTHLAPVHLGSVSVPIRPLLYVAFLGVWCTMAWRLLHRSGERQS